MTEQSVLKPSKSGNYCTDFRPASLIISMKARLLWYSLALDLILQELQRENRKSYYNAHKKIGLSFVTGISQNLFKLEALNMVSR